jgi:multiple sugar transport system ATP-binding protein
VLFTVDAPPVTTEDVRAAIGGAGGADEGRLLADDRRARFTARVHGQHPIVPGETIELAIDTSQLHLFERETGAALPWSRSAKPESRERV